MSLQSTTNLSEGSMRRVQILGAQARGAQLWGRKCGSGSAGDVECGEGNCRWAHTHGDLERMRLQEG
eukprot:356930-Chlamydomonas_euryale.AAC.3